MVKNPFENIKVLESVIDKVVKKNMTGVEKRLTGVERGQKATRSELSRLEVQFSKLVDSQIRLGNKFEDLREDFRKAESNMQKLVDPVMKEILNRQEKDVMHQAQHDRFPALEVQIEKLGQIHPGGAHTII